MMRKSLAFLVFAISVSIFVSGCGSDDEATFTGTRFAVISDAHVYDASLGTSGAAWQEYVLSDRKLLAESEAILASAVDEIMANDPDFLIVPGDLTKDGERVSHELFASYMQKLVDAGIKVLVAPGNHDVNNPHAYAYDGDTVTRVDDVTPDDFKSIYNNMGYADAVAVDSNSLSYISEPVAGLWVFSLDSCNYDNNYADDYPETAGAFSEETLEWISDELARAKRLNKTVFGFMHHGILEHFTGQSGVPSLGDEYVVENWEEVSETFAAEGLNLVFTGHYHAQDAVKRTMDDGSFIFDVETGSLVTYPCPIRTVTLSEEGVADIVSSFVSDIDYDTGGATFTEYASSYLENGLSLQAPYYMIQLFGLPQETAMEMTPGVVNAFVSHYAGDESPTLDDLTEVQTYMASDDATIAMMGGLMGSLLTDLPPADTYVTINITTGDVTE